MRGFRVVGRQPAMARAAERWGAVGLDGRRELRAAGVRGDLRPLDDLASGRRGSAVARGVVQLALDLQEAGMPVHKIKALLAPALLELVDMALPPAA
jgi:hypothetical protein